MTQHDQDPPPPQNSSSEMSQKEVVEEIHSGSGVVWSGEITGITDFMLDLGHS